MTRNTTRRQARSKKDSKVSSAFVVRAVLVTAAIAVAMGLLSSVAMSMINRKLDIDQVPVDQQAEQVHGPDTLRIVQFTPGEFELSTDETAPWDTRWPVSPCSVFVTAGSAPVVDTIPSAETTAFIPVETQFLIESWGRASGLGEAELERLWAFNSYDTLYVDMPRALDTGGLKRTVETRFVCYTLLVPLVNGQLSEGSESGIPLSGVPGVFPRR